jgi:hypothetical protein
MKPLIIIMALLMSACAVAPTPSSRFEGSGVRAEPPIGYTSTCEANPEQEFCKP